MKYDFHMKYKSVFIFMGIMGYTEWSGVRRKGEYKYRRPSS